MQILPSKILAYLCLFLVKGLQTLNKNEKKKKKRSMNYFCYLA